MGGFMGYDYFWQDYREMRDSALIDRRESS